MPEPMFVQRLILADGSILENCGCGYYEKTLGCFLNDFTFGEAFQHFSDPSKFETVIFEMEETYFLTRITYSGFETLSSIIQRENRIEVTITGSNISIEEEKIPKNEQKEE